MKPIPFPSPRLMSLFSEPIDGIPIRRLTVSLMAILDQTDIFGLDFRALGDVILSLAGSLSFRIDRDLLKPMSGWLEDDVRRLLKNEEARTYSWKNYMKRQRRWRKQRKRLAVERLKKYRSELLKRRRFYNEMEENRSFVKECSETKHPFDPDFIKGIVSPFSYREQNRRETDLRFSLAAATPDSLLFPWKMMLRSRIKEADHLNIRDMEFQEKDNPGKETASILIHLLELETAGEIALDQKEPFGDIWVQARDVADETGFILIDRQGVDYQLDWRSLNPAQRSKIIGDLRNRTILYTPEELK